ncbi:vitamin-D-receptor interacting mediator subunit 4-domain-containing protein [Trichophaea hybrida]|nr:vitamin-D-receptor interacting mediator subunit 4-domain-containing protein [Trichophaea hybrida]
MNASVQKALDNLEFHLQTFIESVSSYNPSPAAAQALVQADDELTTTLEKLDEHQQSYRQILTLRETSNALDECLTSLLTTLSETRQQLLDVPSTRFSTPQPREVSYPQLLSYASKISKFSRPPNPAAFKKFASAVLPSQTAQPNAEAETKPVAEVEAGKLPLGLFEEDLPALDPSGMMPFTPWPNEVVMKLGALAMTGPNGVPEDMVPEEERRKVEERKREEEKERGLVNGGPSEKMEQVRRSSLVPQNTSQREKPLMNLSLDLFNGEEDED